MPLSDENAAELIRQVTAVGTNVAALTIAVQQLTEQNNALTVANGRQDERLKAAERSIQEFKADKVRRGKHLSAFNIALISAIVGPVVTGLFTLLIWALARLAR